MESWPVVGHESGAPGDALAWRRRDASGRRRRRGTPARAHRDPQKLRVGAATAACAPAIGGHGGGSLRLRDRRDAGGARLRHARSVASGCRAPHQSRDRPHVTLSMGERQMVTASWARFLHRINLSPSPVLHADGRHYLAQGAWSLPMTKAPMAPGRSPRPSVRKPASPRRLVFVRSVTRVCPGESVRTAD